jgi:hypothetical protein
MIPSTLCAGSPLQISLPAHYIEPSRSRKTEQQKAHQNGAAYHVACRQRNRRNLKH